MSARFRRFRISAKVPESANITSFHLVPADGEVSWTAAPGQYLTLRLPTADGPLLKTYSVSSDTADTRATRITVKREDAPPGAPDAPPGRGSSWLHAHADAGTEIEVAAPRGRFVLDQESARPVLLLSGGVGQTPLLAMLHALARTERAVWYVHACEDGDVHAMHAEVEALVARAPHRLRHHVVYRSPTEGDRRRPRFDATGLVDRARLQSLLPLDDYDCYLCGPVPFMVAVYRLLRALGVPESRIAHEYFGKAKPLATLAAEAAAAEASHDLAAGATASLRPAAGSRAPAALAALGNLSDPGARAAPDEIGTSPGPTPVPLAAPDARGSLPRSWSTSSGEPGVGSGVGVAAPRMDDITTASDADVVFARSGVTVRWSDAVGTLLELAEASGLSPEFSCRSGICSTCLCTVREGDVEYLEEPLVMPGAGAALICCSRPKGRVVLDL